MRHLDWDGCYNVRDLGGFRTTDGRATRRGAVVRADAVDRLSATGWAALREYGIRTIIDLRNDHERAAAHRPAGITTVHLPLDGVEEVAGTELWEHWTTTGLHGTPLYYGPFLAHFPRRIARVVAAIAKAEPGGVLIHCAVGRDRTGLVALVLLALAGVAPEDIAADHILSHARLRPLWTECGEEDQEPIIEELLARKNTSARRVLLGTLASLDVEAYLRDAGLGDDELAAVRARLLAPGDAVDRHSAAT